MAVASDNRAVKLNDLRLVSRCPNEPQKIVTRNVGRRCIDQRMAVYRLELHQALIQNKSYLPIRVVDQGKRSY